MLYQEDVPMKLCENRQEEIAGSTRHIGWSVCTANQLAHKTKFTVKSTSYIVKYAVFISCGILLALHTYTILFYIKNLKSRFVVKYSPKFLLLSLILGTLALLGSVLLVIEPNQFKNGNLLCVLRVWSLGIGIIGSLGTLFTKSYRMDKIFNNPDLKVVKVTNRDLYVVLSILMSIEIAILTVWTAFESERPKFGWVCSLFEDYIVFACDDHANEVDPRKLCIPGTFVEGLKTLQVNQPVIEWSGNTQVLITELVQEAQCTISNSFLLLQLCYLGVIVIWGVILAYRTMNIPKDFNESRWIAVSLYAFATLGPMVLIVYLLDDSRDIGAALQSISLIIGIGTMWALFHGVKVSYCDFIYIFLHTLIFSRFVINFKPNTLKVPNQL